MSEPHMTARAYHELIMHGPKRNKFNVRRVKKGERADGLTFDSGAEANRYDTLRIMERTGEIVAGSIRCQVPYRLDVNGQHVCVYVGDFVYRLTAAPDVEITEDAKGLRTPLFKLKKALMAACLGIDVKEVGRERKRRARFARGKKAKPPRG